MGVFHGFWAGLGVILTKSAKSNAALGVVGNKLPPPGVIIIDEGKSSLLLLGVLGGGVEGGCIRVLVDDLTAGEGEAARYRSKSAPSSPDLAPPFAPVAAAFLFCLFFRERVRIGGVRGGDDRMLAGSNEWMGSKSSSSSSGTTKLGEVKSLAANRC